MCSSYWRWSINKDFIRGDSGYITITTVKGGKRILDPTKLEAAKNLSVQKIDEVDTANSKLATRQDPRMPQSIYIEKGVEDKYDISELFDRVLKVENIEALTVVAKELRDANPSMWKDKKKMAYAFLSLFGIPPDEEHEEEMSDLVGSVIKIGDWCGLGRYLGCHHKEKKEAGE